ncbi:hypothetical protein BDU57DRAFT_26781 [Ampelomyces quisqualis]|uniref:BTB domain-containing protein n=1 Tax=Ampelomyces quisqualis TaxID=50730 RepID=A0A6A5QYI5_AMPQU|nr:hypothetical protein BDU57DRAFT_26781 [Ampelomyces quisqualis]
MDDLRFLEPLGEYIDNSNAVLKAVDGDGRVCHISHRINPFRLIDKCPLLYHAFECGVKDRPQASIEAPSQTAVISLLRYCYTGSYLPFTAEDAPVTLLVHAHVYKMAEDFDIPELQLQAHGNFSVQVDCACSLSTPPHDLLETIRFVYIYFASPQARQQQGLVNTLLNYCISVFQYHQLGESVGFLEVVQQLPEFRQDLCRTNMERNFQDDCAFDIIRLALDALEPQRSTYPTLLASRDLPEVMLYDRPPSPLRLTLPHHIPNAEARPDQGYQSDTSTTSEATMQPSSFTSGQSTLVHRPKFSTMDVGFATDSSTEDEGFSIVHRPRRPITPTLEDLMSSPEIIPSRPIDVLAATGSDYPDDDDDWTML